MHFINTIGHEKQKKLFLRALENNRLAHAYALVGPEHVGKTTFALDLVTSCLKVDERLDLAVFDEEAGIKIEEARRLQNHLSLSRLRSPYKVVILTYAERMTHEAGNALLKILEEPPGRALIFLVTSNYYSLLPTIASRVIKVNFTRVSVEETSQALAKLKLEEERVYEIIELAAGRPGLALRLAHDQEELIFYQQAKVSLKTLLQGSLVERLETAEKLAKLETESLQKFLVFAMQWWVEGSRGLKLATRLQTAYKDLRLNLNTKLLLDNLFLP